MSGHIVPQTVRENTMVDEARKDVVADLLSYVIETGGAVPEKNAKAAMLLIRYAEEILGVSEKHLRISARHARARRRNDPHFESIRRA